MADFVTLMLTLLPWVEGYLLVWRQIFSCLWYEFMKFVAVGYLKDCGVCLYCSACCKFFLLKKWSNVNGKSWRGNKCEERILGRFRYRKEKLFNNKCASCLNKRFWITLSLSNDCIKDFDKTGFKRRYILLLLMASGNILFGICRWRTGAFLIVSINK